MENVNNLFNYGKRDLTIEVVIFFILIPFILTIICISVQFFPKLKDILILQPLNPTPISIFFSSYTHLTFRHLLNNLINYISIIFLILVLETDRKIFFINMLLIFLILPLLISLYIIYYEPNSFPSSGFSGILSGLIGYFPYSVYRYLKKELGILLNERFLVLSLFLIIVFNLLTLFYIYKPLFYNYFKYFVFLFLILLATAYIIRNDLFRIVDKLFMEYKRRMRNYQKCIIAFVCFFTISFLFGAFIVLFPSNIYTDSGKVDIFVHLISYFFGAFIPLALNSFLPSIIGKQIHEPNQTQMK